MSPFRSKVAKALADAWRPHDWFELNQQVENHYYHKASVCADVRPRRVIEIGTRCGYSLVSFATAAPEARYLCVDAAMDADSIDCLLHWQSVVERWAIDADLIVADTQHVRSLPKADFAHVDGDHSFEGALRDLRLVSSCKTILADDWLQPRGQAGGRAVCQRAASPSRLAPRRSAGVCRPHMKIAVYALAKNEVKHVTDWADSCEGADLRIVTDTGSTDGTDEALVQRGVTVCNGYVVPWRWDDAHNLSLNHVPPDVDVCVRLDLDERLQPGWREAIERAWTGEVNSLRYRYIWGWKDDGTPGLEFHCDRVHARHGFRWSQATHEGLICWAGEKRQEFCEGLEIHHRRDAGKKHKTDLFLLEVATQESPHDARAQWYLAREMDYAGHEGTVAAFEKYLAMEGGAATERAYAYRVLHRLTGVEQHLHDSAKAAIGEPDAWAELALANYHRKDWRSVVGFAQQAIEAPWPMTHANDPKAKAKAYDLLAVALWELGKRPQALAAARQAVARLPDEPRLAANVAAMERILEAGSVEAA